MEDSRNGQLNNDSGVGQGDALSNVGIRIGQSNQGGQFGQTGRNSQGDFGVGQNFKQNNLNKEEIDKVWGGVRVKNYVELIRLIILHIKTL